MFEQHEAHAEDDLHACKGKKRGGECLAGQGDAATMSPQMPQGTSSRSR